MKPVEFYQCLECNSKWGELFASFDKPPCPECGEHLDIEETTDKEKRL